MKEMPVMLALQSSLFVHKEKMNFDFKIFSHFKIKITMDNFQIFEDYLAKYQFAKRVVVFELLLRILFFTGIKFRKDSKKFWNIFWRLNQPTRSLNLRAFSAEISSLFLKLL